MEVQKEILDHQAKSLSYFISLLELRFYFLLLTRIRFVLFISFLY
jgi:hypothetical protein